MNMKKLLIFSFLLIFIFLTGTVNATKITIKRVRINGDRTGNYNTVSRQESSTTNAAGEVHITVQIGCADPGNNPCPNASPIGGGGVLDDIDPWVLNYLENRLEQINVEIAGGLSNNNTRIVIITTHNGSQKSYRVYETWECDSNEDGEIILTIEEI